MDNHINYLNISRLLMNKSHIHAKANILFYISDENCEILSSSLIYNSFQIIYKSIS